MERSMNKLTLATAVAAIAMSGSAAFAGSLTQVVVEPPVYMPAPSASVNWTGAYAGVTLGYGRVSFGGGRANLGAAALHVGYNSDMGDWIVGADVAFAPGFNQTVRRRELGWGATARLRAGPKFGDEGRFWGFGTLGFAHVSHDSVLGGDRRSANGWIAGVGISHLMQNNIILTGEVLHGRTSAGGGVNGTGVAVSASYRF